MRHLPLVHVDQRLQDVEEHLLGLVLGVLAALRDAVEEVAALGQLHDQVDRVVLGEDVLCKSHDIVS